MSVLRLVLVAAFGLVAIPIVSASPADALGACPAGSSLVTWPTGYAECLDLSTGAPVLDSHGVNVAISQAEPVSPVPVTQPSSVIAGGEVPGSSIATKAGGAALDSVDSSVAASSVGRVTIFAGVGNAVGTAGAILSAGATGYAIGRTLTSVGCSLGLAAVCYPKPAAGYVPNSTVVVTGDPGWTNGGTYTTPAARGVTDTVSLAWASSSPLYAYGATTQPANLSLVTTVTSISGPASTQGQAVKVESVCVGGAYSGVQMGTNFRTDSTGAAVDNTFHASPYTTTYSSALSECSSASGTSSGGLAYWAIVADDGTRLGTYWPSGNSSRPAPASPNPVRTWKVVQSCSDSSTTTASSASFTETDASLPPIPTAPNCPAGTTATAVKVYETTAGQSDTLLYTTTVPSSITSAPSNYPACANTTCLLTLSKVAATGTSSCFAAGTHCDGWFSDPNKSSDYTCTYGPAGAPTDPSVSLTDCNVYSPTFDPAQQAAGVPYGDPGTGAVPPPLPAPSSTGSSSGTLTTGAPSASGATCFPTGWSAFNPVEWVLDPIECAFVPDPTVVTGQLQTTWSDVQSKPPFSVVAAFVPVISGFVASTGSCGGSIADFGDGLVVPCAPPGNPAWAATLYFVAEVACAGATAFGVWHLVDDGLRKH